MQTLIESIFLILSHLALLPAIINLIILRHLPELTIVTVLFFSSTFYHFCQAGIFCVTSFDTQQKTDHFFVYCTLIWMILYLFSLRLDIRISIFMILQGLLFPFLLFYMNSTWFGGIVIGVTLIMFLFLAGVVARPFPKIYVIDFLVIVVLLGGGFALFTVAGEPGEDNYPWTHTLWHVLSMLSIYFITDLKLGRSFFAKMYHQFLDGVRKRNDKNIKQYKREYSIIELDSLIEKHEDTDKFEIYSDEENNEEFDEENEDDDSEFIGINYKKIDQINSINANQTLKRILNEREIKNKKNNLLIQEKEKNSSKKKKKKTRNSK